MKELLKEQMSNSLDEKWEVIDTHEGFHFKIGEVFSQHNWDMLECFYSPDQYPKLFKKL